MYQWTPLRHTRAIGAWPAVLRQTPDLQKAWFSIRPHRPSRELEREKHQSSQAATSLGCTRYTHSDGREAWQALQRGVDEERASPDDAKTDSKGWNYRRKSGNQTLPLPPFMRPDPSLKAKTRLIQEQRHNVVKEKAMDYGGELRSKKLQDKRRWKKKSAFTAAFLVNPYAHALAAPVRQDSFTQARMPHSCLVGFKLNDDAEEGEPEEVSLFPVSLAAEALPKKRPNDKMNSAQQAAKAAQEAEMATIRDVGMTTFVICKQAAMEVLSESPVPKTIRAMGMTRRAVTVLERSDLSTVKWREDMPNVILNYLQTIVAKQLSFLLRTKKSANSPGTVQAIPADESKSRLLDNTEDVGCVLRLKPFIESRGEELDAPNLGPAPDTEAAMEQVAGMTGTSSPFQVSHVLHESVSPDQVDTGEDMAPSSTDATEEDWLNIADQVPEHESTEQEPTPPRVRIRARSTTIHWKNGWWQKNEGFLRLVGPLPPPAKPSATYFPTMRYRNRRIATYNIPGLLGAATAANLIKNTSFADSELVAVGLSTATLGVQDSLMKLVAFLGRGKKETEWM